MYEDFLNRASKLHEQDEAFVVATVVRCEAPTSGKPGDRAIITADGKISGWIGGGCAQPIVIEEALKSLKDGKSRLIRVSPTAGAEPADGITGYTMMCHSGGTLDIFVEPVLAKPHIIIFGRSPVATILAGLAKTLSYRVSQISEEDGDPQRITNQTAIVVATQGEDDEGALERALAMDAPYVAFVASKKKWEAVSSFLREKGVGEDRLKSVHVPAGLNIGAKTPEEIAVSILAQTIQTRRKVESGDEAASFPKLSILEAARAKDPVCGMTVAISTAKYSSDCNGKTIYFCCAHCKASFDKTPAKFINA
jgi:xanthine dehydrogenase accessory factor